MMHEILEALHKVMTGQAIPSAAVPTSAPALGVWGIGDFEGIYILLGADRLQRGLPAEYFPILAIDDGHQSIWGTVAQYGVQITTSILVPTKLGAIFGWRDREKYKKGILDVIDAIVGALRTNEFLIGKDGEVLTSGLSGKIDVRRDSSTDSRGMFITNQIATISVAYEAYREEGV